jgi:divalent metal cation (Fe/Co/Zn/Cd) transporter
MRFGALAAYLLAQSTIVLAAGYHPRRSALGIVGTAVTAVVMFALAAGKARTGRVLGNPVLRTEGRVTLMDGILAAAVLLGLVLNAALGPLRTRAHVRPSRTRYGPRSHSPS